MSVPSAAEIVESVRTTLPLSKEEAATYLVDIKSPFYVEGVSKETAIQLLDKVGGIPKCIQDYSDKIKQEAEEKSKAKNPKEKKKGRKAFDLKTPKGTVDYDPWQMAIRESVFNKITTVFKRHGGVTIETPVFELKETLLGKYGEDQKLVYDLADQGGELCSLRYDLTVPFARYMASHRNVKSMKRYHIGRVYRRDQPSLSRGRYREFYQCDFDIAGLYDPMLPEAEIVKIATEIFDSLEIGEYVIKLNHRLILDGILELCGVPAENFRPICSAIDKLDKLSWQEVRDEMVNVKKLDPDVADKIQPLVALNGRCRDLLEKLSSEKTFAENKSGSAGLSQMALLFDYLEAYGVADRCYFDLSLARGLDYYTGIIFEAITLDKSVGVGSISGGGRYDNLIEMFGGEKVPSIGFSVGIERVFTILEQREKRKKVEEKMRTSETEVLVMSPDQGMLIERMKICRQLWNAGIKAELLHKQNPKIKAQLNYADEHRIPFGIIIGSQEAKDGVLNVKSLYERSQLSVKQEYVVAAVQALLRKESVPVDFLAPTSEPQ